MSPLNSIALYGLAVSCTAVLAAPGVNSAEVNINLIEPVYEPPPANEGPWIPCEFSDDLCACTKYNGALKHYCSWVDQSWTSGPFNSHWGSVTSNSTDNDCSSVTLCVSPESLDPGCSEAKNLDLGVIADHQFPSSTAADPSSPAGIWRDDKGNVSPENSATGGMPGGDSAPGSNQPHKRDFPKIINLTRRNPLQAALNMVSFSARKVIMQQLFAITTKFSDTEQAQYVQGVSGHFTEVLQVDDGQGFIYPFKKDATFMIRWDFTGLPAQGGNYPNTQRGLHVKLAIEDGSTKQQWAFYQASTSSKPQYFDFVGDYVRILAHQNTVAGYTPAPAATNAKFQSSENGGAQALVTMWHNYMNPNDQL